MRYIPNKLETPDTLSDTLYIGLTSAHALATISSIKSPPQIPFLYIPNTNTIKLSVYKYGHSSQQYIMLTYSALCILTEFKHPITKLFLLKIMTIFLSFIPIEKLVLINGFSNIKEILKSYVVPREP